MKGAASCVQKPFKSAANAGTVPKLQPLWLPRPLQPQLAAKNIKKGDRQQHFVVPTEQTSVVEGTAEEEQMKGGKGAAWVGREKERDREKGREGERGDSAASTFRLRWQHFRPASATISAAVSLSISLTVSLAIGTLPAVNVAYEAGSAPTAAAAVATAHFAMRSKGSFVLHVYKYASINRNIFTFF